MTKVEISVTIINGVGGTYPLIAPLKSIPSGTATAHPFTTIFPVETITLLSLEVSSGEYTRVNGEVVNQAVTNGNAVIKTAHRSRSPLALWDDFPIAAKMMRLMVSTTARSGRLSGVYIWICCKSLLLFSKIDSSLLFGSAAAREVDNLWCCRLLSLAGKLLLLICCRSNGVVVFMARGTTSCEAPTTCVLMGDKNPSTVSITDRDDSNNINGRRCLSREEKLILFCIVNCHRGMNAMLCWVLTGPTCCSLLLWSTGYLILIPTLRSAF